MTLAVGDPVLSHENGTDIRYQIRLERFRSIRISDIISVSEYLNCTFIMLTSNRILSDMVDTICI
jgi:hypothetical protein